ncbi:unnamed protein product [Parnassius mnemosyne]|uniref:Ig-like domain-containing protein n=1 Tax=Parnassius mnemosyne TaxID=213953 RepID=A0AAV1K8K0_9NEOP
MKSQTAYLDVVVPPDILDYPTSSDQVAREGANITLRCAAHGVPTPNVVWRRESGDLLPTTKFSDLQIPPIMTIQNQLIGALHGDSVTLECHSEAFPKSINYWTINGHIISQSDTRFDIIAIEKGYEVIMKLKIKKVSRGNFGTYTCISKNSLGDTDGTIKLYSISGQFEDKQYSDLNVLEENPDVSELEALKRSLAPESVLINFVLLLPALVILAEIYM